MKALLVVTAAVLAASLGFLVASCGSDGDANSAGPVPSAGTTTDGTSEEIPTTTVRRPPRPSTETETEPEPRPSLRARTSRTRFGSRARDGLFVTYRTEPATPRVGTAALESLLEGPDSFETGYGLRTAIPDGTQLLGLSIDDGIARVDLTSEFESGGGSLSMQPRLAQIVYTITQFPTVKGVVFSLDGQPIDVLGGEGVIIDHPLTRRDFADLLPAILVTSPALNQAVESPSSSGAAPTSSRRTWASRSSTRTRGDRRDVHHGDLRHRLPRHLSREGRLRGRPGAGRHDRRARRRRRRHRHLPARSPHPGPAPAVKKAATTTV